MPTTTTAPTATKTTASPAMAKAAKPRKPLPAPNSDFYYLYETLPAEELAVVKRDVITNLLVWLSGILQRSS